MVPYGIFFMEAGIMVSYRTSDSINISIESFQMKLNWIILCKLELNVGQVTGIDRFLIWSATKQVRKLKYTG